MMMKTIILDSAANVIFMKRSVMVCFHVKKHARNRLSHIYKCVWLVPTNTNWERFSQSQLMLLEKVREVGMVVERGGSLQMLQRDEEGGGNGQLDPVGPSSIAISASLTESNVRDAVVENDSDVDHYGGGGRFTPNKINRQTNRQRKRTYNATK